MSYYVVFVVAYPPRCELPVCFGACVCSSPFAATLPSSNQHFSFYDLIVTKARGKSGPLFHFDVHDDIRLVHDTRVEKDESHPGKVGWGL